MPSPDFSPDELALLAQLRQTDRSWLAFPLAYLLPSGLLVIFGFLYREPGAFAAAFAVIATFTFWGLRVQAAGAETLRSILHKYEMREKREEQRATEEAR